MVYLLVTVATVDNNYSIVYSKRARNVQHEKCESRSRNKCGT